MAQGDQPIVIDKMFSKGIVQDLGKNKTPDYFADDLRNVRIENGWITVCNGYNAIYSPETQGAIKWIIYNANNDSLYLCHDSKFQELDIDNSTLTDLWNINTNNRCRFIVYGDYTIILTGDDRPYYYDGNTFAQVTSWELDANVNPQFWASFAWFTVINNQLDPNVMMVSRPITLANQGYCKDWKGTNSEQISTRGKIQWFAGALNRLWIFTDQTIEFIDRNNVTTTWGVASLFTVIRTDWEQLVNSDSIVVAGNAVYFFTKDKKIKILWYENTLEEPQITTISDLENQSIDQFMQDYLAEDQSDAFGIHDKERWLIKFFCKSIFSTENDICIIWDITNKTRLIDDDRPYSCMTRKGKQLFSGSPYNLTVFEDENWTTFNGKDIDRYYLSTTMTFGAVAQVKQFRGLTVSWQINSDTNIEREIFVDNKSVFNNTIQGSNYFVGEILWWAIGTNPIWWQMIGWWERSVWNNGLSDFSKVITHGNLRSTGKYIQMKRSGKGKWQQFILDNLTATYRLRKRYRLKDK